MKNLVKELRNKRSRDNRELLDRAADRIEELEKTKAEVAREILEKLDRFINSNCIEIRDEQGRKGYVTCGVHFAISEFKKRYTEG